ncbi:MAG: hypothetical protein KatS3mg002_0866 [Candidatus Woesearchaeota archaeon]|nr:MAG: hypothetical protein KatS3mg002_0866 [Candidatus Woesearchaeota archaeon]
MDIVPPEVPKPEKKSFFKKLFSKGDRTQDSKQESSGIIEKPKLEEFEQQKSDYFNSKKTEEYLMNSSLPELPTLDIPSLDDNNKVKDYTNTALDYKTDSIDNNTENIILTTDTTNLFDEKNSPNELQKNKSSKRKTKNIEKIDETSKFDWAKSIEEQSNIILDNNRNNEDIKNLITSSDQHIEDQKRVLNSKVLTLPENLPELKFDKPEVPETEIEQIPMPPKEKQFFSKVEKEHKKLRNEIKKSMKHFTKEGFIRLLKQYDDKIETIIAEKKLEYSRRSWELSQLSKNLNDKQKSLNELQRSLKNLQKRLEEKEKTLEETVTKHVEKQLINRTKKEKQMLKKELQKTIMLNKNLKNKIDTIEKDREQLEQFRKKLIEEHQKKMNELHTTYERKLDELRKEREEFEERRKRALALLHKADLIQKEKENLDKLKDILAQKRQMLKEKLYEDKELKDAIEKAEAKLSEERAKLDEMIFSKYIKWKLSGADDSDSVAEILKNPVVDEINNMIVECRSKVVNGNITEAKRLYNAIKRKFESSQIDDYNKSLLFNSIRELYSDINLATLKP